MSEISIRECATVEEFDACVRLQREAFGLPDLELSPRRHLIVSRAAGGFVLGAFAGSRMVGFVHTLAAVREGRPFAYSHMMAVAPDFQNRRVGARLKWAQRERALREGWDFVKWTFEPVKARNAHFNINRLGAIVRVYAENFYGTDYHTSPDEQGQAHDLDSDRLVAEWHLRAPRVEALARQEHEVSEATAARPSATVEIPSDWGGLLRRDSQAARGELLRVRAEFQNALRQGFVCAGFERHEDRPRYLFYQAAG